MKKYKHVMCDVETLGTTADSVIMSIGAVRFDLNSDALDDEGFYASISIESNLEHGRKLSEDTLCWWLKQSPEAQQVFHEPKQALEGVLEDFTTWFAGSDYIWSNGADFDIPMLAHAYSQLGWQTPWKFFNARCFRTFKSQPFAERAKKPEAIVKHNALDDAVAQARHAQAIQAVLNDLMKGKVSA